ncbi:unnamed protein product [Onchocerca flexuosa]|uniref:Uncharacterized protein n=1 Tax=Onchocerca flexuosa TaxID=387005 RepID=A0A183HJT3_9BILA|nr:unnamed protein product [Onchocerca flexuosa]
MQSIRNNEYFSLVPLWDSPNGPNVPLIPLQPISSEHNDEIIATANTSNISNAVITPVHHIFTNAYMQIQPEIQTSVETSSSNNTIDSKKRHHRRGVKTMEDVSFAHNLCLDSNGSSSIVCHQQNIEWENNRKRNKRNMINTRSSKRCLRNRSRSLGAHQRSQVQRSHRPSFPTNLATTAASSSFSSNVAAIADVSTSLREQSKQTFETISG